MTEKNIFGFKSTMRLKEVGEKLLEHIKDREHYH